jgi:hypothetical protein
LIILGSCDHLPENLTTVQAAISYVLGNGGHVILGQESSKGQPVWDTTSGSRPKASEIASGHTPRIYVPAAIQVTKAWGAAELPPSTVTVYDEGGDIANDSDRSCSAHQVGLQVGETDLIFLDHDMVTGESTPGFSGRPRVLDVWPTNGGGEIVAPGGAQPVP